MKRLAFLKLNSKARVVADGGCPLTFILTKDEGQSTEYIGVPPPCYQCILTAEFHNLDF